MSRDVYVAHWKPARTAPEGVVVLTKIHDSKGERNHQPLKRRGRLWWLPDGSMYVYYTPTHWASDGEPAMSEPKQCAWTWEVLNCRYLTGCGRLSDRNTDFCGHCGGRVVSAY